MNTFISLLRGINVSGQKKIKMEVLKQSFVSLEFSFVRTYIQSGNVIFSTDIRDTEEISRLIEKKIIEDFGFDVDVLIRDAIDYEELFHSNPFLPERREELKKLHITFLKNRPEEALVTAVPNVSDEGEEFVINDRHIYLYCPNGYGRVRFTNSFFEKKFKVPATTRNWNTVMKLLDLSREN